jgi:hypothetical protein
MVPGMSNPVYRCILAAEVRHPEVVVPTVSREALLDESDHVMPPPAVDVLELEMQRLTLRRAGT